MNRLAASQFPWIMSSRARSAGGFCEVSNKPTALLQYKTEGVEHMNDDLGRGQVRWKPWAMVVTRYAV